MPNVEQLKKEFAELKTILMNISSPIVFSHNDLLLGNILFDRENHKVFFIDYEYAAFNFQAYDIGNHFTEFAGMTNEMQSRISIKLTIIGLNFLILGMTDIDYSYYPSKEFQLKWLREYLINYHETESISDDQVLKLYADVNKFALIAHLFWGLWAHNQAEHSEINYDFIDFARMRFNEYFAKKHKFLTL